MDKRIIKDWLINNLHIAVIIIACILIIIFQISSMTMRFTVTGKIENKQELFIIDMEKIEDTMIEPRWLLTYTLDGVPYTVLFYDEEKGNEFIRYLEGRK